MLCCFSDVRLFAALWSWSGNTGVGCYALLQGILQMEWLNLCFSYLVHWQVVVFFFFFFFFKLYIDVYDPVQWKKRDDAREGGRMQFVGGKCWKKQEEMESSAKSKV